MRQISCVVFAIVLAGGPLFAEDKVEIVHRPDYSPGAVYRQLSETAIDQTLVLAGMNVPSKVETYITVLETVGEPTDEGKTQISSEFEHFIVDLETPVGDYSFDSARDESSNVPPPLQPVDDLFRATSTAKWTTTLNSKPEIESIEFEGDPFEGIAEEMQSEVSPKKFKEEYNTQLRRFPEGPVAEGDSWKRTEEFQAGNGQVLTFEKEFVYLGVEVRNGRTLDKIGVKTLTVDYDIGAGSQLPLTLDSSELEIAESEGQMLYDRELKMVTENSEKTQIVGNLGFTVSIGGQEQKLPGELDLTIQVKVTTDKQDQ